MSRKCLRIVTRDGLRHIENTNRLGRVTFKNSSRGNNFRNFSNHPVSLLKLMEDDVSMEGGSSSGLNNNNNNNNNNYNNNNYNNNYRGRGRGSYRGGRGGGGSGGGARSNNEIPFSKSGWYKITIPHAKDLDKDFIIKSINGLLKTPMMPWNFSYENKMATFNIKGTEEARAVKGVSKRITTPNGFKMIILVGPCAMPPTDINSAVVEKMKIVMSRRYKAEMFFLDLSSFAKDPEFLSQNINLTMMRPKVINNVLDIIAQNIPEIKVLDLSDNELNGLGILSTLSEKAPNLISLNLAKNRLTSESDLISIKKLKLEEIMLEGNPLQQRFKDKQLYIRAVRQKFPNVLRLDGQTLPPPINFNVEPTELPTTKGNYFDDDVIRAQVCLFIEQYYSLYDNGNREGLAGAYHDQAIFSVSAFFNRTQITNQSNLSEYIKISHNLKRIEDREKLLRVKSGREEIISTLKKLPPTNHDPNSFVVDVVHVDQSLLIFTLNGVFIETSSPTSSVRNKPIRHFNRLVVAVPNKDGIAIINEMLTITNLNNELTEKYKAILASSEKTNSTSSSTSSSVSATKSSSTVAAGQAASAAATSSFDGTILTPTQKTMVEAFCQMSGMNEYYSHMCLSGNNWIFDQAAIKFHELHQSNNIPAEAFIK